jgi:DNA-binding transcriptional MerR regulator
MEKALPAIPAKRYFTIGEVSELCGVKPYVLRYWEQEFTQLKPMKRRGNRRYYQHHEVLLIRRIRELLYDQGFTISGARNRLADAAAAARQGAQIGAEPADGAAEAEAPRTIEVAAEHLRTRSDAAVQALPDADTRGKAAAVVALAFDVDAVRQELQSIRELLSA